LIFFAERKLAKNLHHKIYLAAGTFSAAVKLQNLLPRLSHVCELASEGRSNMKGGITILWA
jgi:hypothetical protein